MNIRSLVATGAACFLAGLIIFGAVAYHDASVRDAKWRAEEPPVALCPPKYHLLGWAGMPENDGRRHSREWCVRIAVKAPIHFRSEQEAKDYLHSSGLEEQAVRGTVGAPR